MFDKTRLARQFGQSAAYYHHHATVQHYGADRLLGWLTDCSIPLGKVLEVGCGTGFLTQGLVDLLLDHDLEISDLSEILGLALPRAVVNSQIARSKEVSPIAPPPL